MKTKSITHSKFRNPGILFELLVRQITVDTLEGKDNSPAINLMRKYFKPNTELGKEYQLYQTLLEMNNLTESKALQLIDLVGTQRNKLDEVKLAKEKYEFIKEIKSIYDLKEFLQVKIPAYKVYASIYKTFLAESVDFNVTSIQEVAMARFSLIEHLMRDRKIVKNPTSETDIIEVFKNQTEDLRMLTHKIMLDRFNEKYANLNGKQRKLIKEYINSVSDSEEFARYVRSEIDPLREEIKNLAETQKNKVLKIKLNEVSSQLNTIKDRKKIRDGELTSMMIAYQILEEMRNTNRSSI